MLRHAKVNFLDKEDMMGHKVGLESHYERYQEEDFERFSEYQKAISFLIISDEDRLLVENQQKQQDIEEIQKKNKELQDLSARVTELENGPDARWNKFYKLAYEYKDDSTSMIWLRLSQLLFEMRAPESEKRIIWKKIQDAQKKGKRLDISEFGESKFSFDNFNSEL